MCHYCREFPPKVNEIPESVFRYICVLDKKEDRGFYYYDMQYVSKNIISKIKVLEMGIPFYEKEGFPKLSPCYVTNWEFPHQNVCYNCEILMLKLTL